MDSNGLTYRIVTSVDPDPFFTVVAYLAYLAVSVALTIWVAHVLRANGRAFLVDAFQGDTLLADSANRLLVVGFFLINGGYVSLALRYGTKPSDVQTALEFVSTKLGLALLVMGAMHFVHLRIFSVLRQRSLQLQGRGVISPARVVPPHAMAR